MSRINKNRNLSRRDFMQLSALGVLGSGMSGWLQRLAAETADDPQRKRACILLWMSGGPSQCDTFDLKPEHENGGPFKPIDTDVPGIQISEHLPKLASVMKHLVPIRSMSTKEGDHTRATYLLRTGYLPSGPLSYPTMGSLLSKELGASHSELPNFVSIAPNSTLSPNAYGPGFLGPQYAPLVVGEGTGLIQTDDQNVDTALKVKNLALPQGITRKQADSRLSILKDLENDFIATHPGIPTNSHRSAYEAAVRMMRSKAIEAFQLDQEPDTLRDAYGRNRFGQGCLLARRLIQQGVPFVEVSLNGVQGTNAFGWDTHQQNFEAVKSLSEVLDPAWGTLMTDLEQRGLLDSTLIVWMGEFGRTPKINQNTGRDHFPAAWTTVLGGGGIRGGQVIGKTSEDGMKVTDQPVAVPDLMATICKALGVDPEKQNMSNIGRPIPLADHGAKPIDQILKS
ncbi:DUF1501 domain-containing protein [Gimesia aquarii]|uniref:DUF1501 domain-containing protein n=1 Tax=Gimesia aquarii TaxID=2527964 RepID=A0A517VNJ5_9PLAN|nr:DUF1501 domain-containing protein [Gimesia aquarii]QDT94597.1 hypothetical protein V144x_00270 [Gimesia aquarii]